MWMFERIFNYLFGEPLPGFHPCKGGQNIPIADQQRPEPPSGSGKKAEILSTPAPFLEESIYAMGGIKEVSDEIIASTEALVSSGKRQYFREKIEMTRDEASGTWAVRVTYKLGPDSVILPATFMQGEQETVDA